jgi:hypothetical protein
MKIFRLNIIACIAALLVSCSPSQPVQDVRKEVSKTETLVEAKARELASSILASTLAKGELKYPNGMPVKHDVVPTSWEIMTNNAGRWSLYYFDKPDGLQALISFKKDGSDQMVDQLTYISK